MRDPSTMVPAAFPVLETRQLGVDFGGLTALDAFSISVAKSEIVGLVGSGGAGKTTVFNLLTNVCRPTRGSILINGQSTAGKSPERVGRMGISRVYPNIRLYGNMSVLDNIRFGMNYTFSEILPAALTGSFGYGKAERKATEKAMELLSLFSLASKMESPAGSLSCGAQRKLELIRALTAEPAILLLDEPSSGMTFSETAELMLTLQQIQNNFHTAIVLIEHDNSPVMDICEQICVLHCGKILTKGTAQEIRKKSLSSQSRENRKYPVFYADGRDSPVVSNIPAVHYQPQV